jgi:hypothetical protein
VYRPPGSDKENDDKLCDLIRFAEKDTILLGDFNMPGIRWKEWTSDARGREFMETVAEVGMEQLIHFPTHTKGNILDLVVTNCPERIVNVSDMGRLGKSDHSMILIEVEMTPEKKRTVQSGMNWRKADSEGMRYELENEGWEELLRNAGIEEAWSIFRRRLEEMIEKYVPRFVNTRKRRPEWITQEIVRQIRKKKRLWKVWSRQGGAENERKYREQEMHATKLVRNAKRGMEKKIANDKEDRNGRKFTRYIKSKTKSRTGIGPLKDRNGMLLTEDKEMARELNGFFVEVFTKDDGTPVPGVVIEMDQEEETLVVTEGMVRKKILELRADAAAGPAEYIPNCSRH